MNQISEKQLNEAEKQFKMFESLINSMTSEERSNPDLLAKVRTQKTAFVSPCSLQHVYLYQDKEITVICSSTLVLPGLKDFCAAWQPKPGTSTPEPTLNTVICCVA